MKETIESIIVAVFLAVVVVFFAAVVVFFAAVLALAGDFAMSHAQDMIHLIYSAADSVWIEVSRSNNA